MVTTFEEATPHKVKTTLPFPGTIERLPSCSPQRFLHASSRYGALPYNSDYLVAFSFLTLLHVLLIRPWFQFQPTVKLVNSNAYEAWMRTKNRTQLHLIFI
ncbi:hypothetical protein AAHE18_10G076300 [Arachis hypogaea]